MKSPTYQPEIEQFDWPIRTGHSTSNNIAWLVRPRKVSLFREFSIGGFAVLFQVIFQKFIEGLVVEDVITTGSSVLENVHILQDAYVGMGMSHTVVLLDRKQGGRGNINGRGVEVMSVMTLSQLMGFLLDAGKVSTETVDIVRAFITEHSALPLPDHTPQAAVSRS